VVGLLSLTVQTPLAVRDVDRGAQVITSPFHLVALPTRAGRVRFEKID
jgi:hypothetical protein